MFKEINIPTPRKYYVSFLPHEFDRFKVATQEIYNLLGLDFTEDNLIDISEDTTEDTINYTVLKEKRYTKTRLLKHLQDWNDGYLITFIKETDHNAFKFHDPSKTPYCMDYEITVIFRIKDDCSHLGYFAKRGFFRLLGQGLQVYTDE